MSIADSVYQWWYFGLGGVGGWIVFLFIALAAMASVFVHSSNRGLRVPGWRLGTIAPIILLLPTVLFRFGDMNIDPQASEWFLVLGVLGTAICIAAAVGYFASFWGQEAPSAEMPAPMMYVPPVQPEPIAPPRAEMWSPAAPVKRRERAMAWLVDEAAGRQYQLFKGDTRIGRKPEANDIVLNNPTVSREHALIREGGGVFTIYDRGSTGGTLVNSQRIRQPVILYHGDVIELGEVRLVFMSSQR